MNDSTGLELSGIDGSNPLGFLAALGVLRSLTLAKPQWRPKLAWEVKDVWRPVLYFQDIVSKDKLLDELNDFLSDAPGKEALELGDDIKFTPEFFHSAVIGAFSAAKLENQEALRFYAAFGSEATEKDGLIKDTDLRTMSGAGHQHFLKFMRDLIENTEYEHLRKALFFPWSWDDPQPSLRWDQTDDRRYALRWREPSSDPIRTVRGANRLAIEALPLFTTVAQGSHLNTVGFKGSGSKTTYWTWPIWELPSDLDTVRSLLSLQSLQTDSPDRKKLQAMGIGEIYRSQRLTIGKYRNFTPAMPV